VADRPGRSSASNRAAVGAGVPAGPLAKPVTAQPSGSAVAAKSSAEVVANKARPTPAGVQLHQKTWVMDTLLALGSQVLRPRQGVVESQTPRLQGAPGDCVPAQAFPSSGLGSRATAKHQFFHKAGIQQPNQGIGATGGVAGSPAHLRMEETGASSQGQSQQGRGHKDRKGHGSRFANRRP